MNNEKVFGFTTRVCLSVRVCLYVVQKSDGFYFIFQVQ